MGPLAAVGIGSGLTMPITAAILGVLPQAQAGVAGGILNAAREASGAARRHRHRRHPHRPPGRARLAAGATPHAAFLAGYSAGLAAAAALVLVGGVIALRTMPGPRDGPPQAGRTPARCRPVRAVSRPLPSRPLPPSGAPTLPSSSVPAVRGAIKGPPPDHRSLQGHPSNQRTQQPERKCPEMMDGMYGIGVAMMITGSAAAASRF